MEGLKVLIFFALLVCARAEDAEQKPATLAPLKVVDEEVSPDYWLKQAKERFAKDCKMFSSLRSAPHAKNVIMLLGDGMGMPTISASRFYIAEMEGRNGSAVFHPFEEWEFNTMARTYDLETSVTDSASSANAYLTGSKTRTGMIGIDGNLNVKQCGKWDSKYFTHSVLEAAYKAGKATGVITNTRITHASPSGTYAHVTFRDMENDAKIKEFCPTEYKEMYCQDIACQLIQDHQYINVIVGGGKKNFYPAPEKPKADDATVGVRLDGRNLIEEWEKNKTEKGKKFCFVGKPENLSTCNPSEVDYMLALPYDDHMPYTHDIPLNEPNLLDYVDGGGIRFVRKEQSTFLIESG
nr:alkaline phosphatase [Hymenolepis microstoma]